MNSWRQNNGCLTNKDPNIEWEKAQKQQNKKLLVLNIASCVCVCVSVWRDYGEGLPCKSQSTLCYAPVGHTAFWVSAAHRHISPFYNYKGRAHSWLFSEITLGSLPAWPMWDVIGTWHMVFPGEPFTMVLANWVLNLASSLVVQVRLVLLFSVLGWPVLGLPW